MWPYAAMIANEQGCLVFRKKPDGQYDLVRITDPSSSLYQLMSLCWIRARYSALVVDELTAYCAGSTPKNATIAHAWLKEVKSAMSYGGSIQIAEPEVLRQHNIDRERAAQIGTVSTIMTLMGNGTIVVDDLPTR